MKEHTDFHASEWAHIHDLWHQPRLANIICTQGDEDFVELIPLHTYNCNSQHSWTAWLQLNTGDGRPYLERLSLHWSSTKGYNSFRSTSFSSHSSVILFNYWTSIESALHASTNQSAFLKQGWEVSWLVIVRCWHAQVLTNKYSYKIIMHTKTTVKSNEWHSLGYGTGRRGEADLWPISFSSGTFRCDAAKSEYRRQYN